MAFKMKKPWGLVDHPWLPSLIVMDLWVTLPKIKVKEVKTIDCCHNYPLVNNIKHIRLYLSSQI